MEDLPAYCENSQCHSYPNRGKANLLYVTTKGDSAHLCDACLAAALIAVRESNLKHPSHILVPKIYNPTTGEQIVMTATDILNFVRAAEKATLQD